MGWIYVEQPIIYTCHIKQLYISPNSQKWTESYIDCTDLPNIIVNKKTLSTFWKKKRYKFSVTLFMHNDRAKIAKIFCLIIRLFKNINCNYFDTIVIEQFIIITEITFKIQCIVFYRLRLEGAAWNFATFYPRKNVYKNHVFIQIIFIKYESVICGN